MLRDDVGCRAEAEQSRAELRREQKRREERSVVVDVIGLSVGVMSRVGSSKHKSHEESLSHEREVMLSK